MSEIVASLAINGAISIIKKADAKINAAIARHGKELAVGFPNTAYHLPVIFSMTGEQVKTLADCLKFLASCKKSLAPFFETGKLPEPTLGNALGAGLATLYADELIEVLNYIEPRYVTGENCPEDGPAFWLGAAEDLVLRRRGLEFVSGTAPGCVLCVGSAPTNEDAVALARSLQSKYLYTFIASRSNGVSMADQLRQSKVAMGWESRLVPFGEDSTAAVFAVGFAAKAAMSFGGVKPGDSDRILAYIRERIKAFVLALGPLDEEKVAQAAGAMLFGIPVIADTAVPHIPPVAGFTYDMLLPSIPSGKMAAKGVELRSIKVPMHDIKIPVPYGPAFEGERIRRNDMMAEYGGGKAPSFELVSMASSDAVEDGRINLVGPDIVSSPEGGTYPLAIVAEVVGKNMITDYEPILERRMHSFLNEPNGVFHMGQRDMNMVRISKAAYAAGFRLKHLGVIIHAKLHSEFGSIIDKAQVTLYTDEKDVLRLKEKARATYKARDERLGNLTDDKVGEFYSCTLCQSFAPTHVCIVTPERSGLCGAYNWLDCKASFQMNPKGPNQPIPKKGEADLRKGRWDSIDEFVVASSQKTISSFCLYSIVDNPMTSCGCFEVISAVLPMANGVMCVNREHQEMTPCGMKFSTLASTVGGGLQTPGFMGHSRNYITSKKFLFAEDGIKRVIWMPKSLKDALREEINTIAARQGVDDFCSKIADETVATTEEEIMAFMKKVSHPALGLPPLI